jgi:hypothetical protein
MHSMSRHFASEKNEKQQASVGLSIRTQTSEENHPYALKRLVWALAIGWGTRLRTKSSVMLYRVLGQAEARETNGEP